MHRVKIGHRSRRLALMLAGLLIAATSLAEAPRYYTYLTVKGDHLSGIAKRFMVKTRYWQELQKLNQVNVLTQLKIGTPIRIPVEMMRTESAPAKVIAVQGKVELGSSPLLAGASVKQGDKLTTAEDSFVTMQLADGSVINVQPKSAIEISSAKQYANTGGVTDSVINVKSGRVETSVAKQKGPAARYEIRTATSNMAVRGTVFRVAADDSGERSQSEVIEGAVGINSASANSANPANSTELALAAGYGSVIPAGQPPSAPIALLAAPILVNLQKEFTRSPVNFKFDSIAEAVSYRGQVARDAEFKNMLIEAVANEPELQFTALPDGDLYLRVRAIDKQRLEGNSAVHAFQLKVHPLAPLGTQPALNSTLGNTPKFEWLASADAKSYRLQVANDAAFQKLAVNQADIATTSFTPSSKLEQGRYFWRLASITPTGETGVYSDAQTFLINPPVALRLNVSKAANQRNQELVWEGDADKSYQIQISTSDTFIRVIRDMPVTGTKLSLNDLPVNTYYVRVRQAQTGGEWSNIERVDIYPF